MDEQFFEARIREGGESRLLDLVQSGSVSVADRDCMDRTPLMVALEIGSTDLVVALLALGSDASGKSDDGATCLSRAIENGDLGLVKILVEAGADLELYSTGFLTPLSLAAIRGNTEIMRYLLSKGSNIEARGEMEETPLIEAAFHGQSESVALLLNSGANRNAIDTFGRTFVDAANNEFAKQLRKSR